MNFQTLADDNNRRVTNPAEAILEVKRAEKIKNQTFGQVLTTVTKNLQNEKATIAQEKQKTQTLMILAGSALALYFFLKK